MTPQATAHLHSEWRGYTYNHQQLNINLIRAKKVRDKQSTNSHHALETCLQKEVGCNCRGPTWNAVVAHKDLIKLDISEPSCHKQPCTKKEVQNPPQREPTCFRHQRWSMAVVTNGGTVHKCRCLRDLAGERLCFSASSLQLTLVLVIDLSDI